MAPLSEACVLAVALRAAHLWIVYDGRDGQVRVRVQQLLNVGHDVGLGIHQHIAPLHKSGHAQCYMSSTFPTHN